MTLKKAVKENKIWQIKSKQLKANDTRQPNETISYAVLHLKKQVLAKIYPLL